MSTGGPAPFFRGRELGGLVIFSVMVIVGWVVVVGTASRKAREEAAPPVAADPRPLEPDTSLAFQGLLDRTEMGPRDNAAYKTLLDRTRETPPAKLTKDARRDVFFTHLWERPDLYRGVPVHLEGTLRRVLPHEKVSEVFTPKGRLLEAWFFTPESLRLPYVVMVEDAPKGLPIGDNLNERVVVDAYFLKLLRYKAGDTDRAAPLLVGRIRWTPSEAPSLPVPAKDWRNARGFVIALVLAALGIYLTVRLLSAIRRATAPHRRPSSRGLDRPTEEVPPGDLADWLANVPEEDEDEDEPSR